MPRFNHELIQNTESFKYSRSLYKDRVIDKIRSLFNKNDKTCNTYIMMIKIKVINIYTNAIETIYYLYFCYTFYSSNMKNNIQKK